MKQLRKTINGKLGNIEPKQLNFIGCNNSFVNNKRNEKQLLLNTLT